MFSLSIHDETPGALESIVSALRAGLTSREINAAVGRACAQLTSAHLYDLAGRRHRPNVAQNFYADAAQAVTHRDLGEEVEIRIDKAGIAQRYYGGEIRAVNDTHLWIPVAPESEGKSAGEFDDLVPIISPLTNKGVAIQGGKVLFALVESVTQDADPTVLPTTERYAETSAETLDLLLDSILEPTP